MNFFKAQDNARKNTSRLIILFFLAVVFLILLTNLLLIGTFAYMGSNESESFTTLLSNSYDLKTITVISIGIILLITIGSIYKISSLSNGGQAIAEMLGGKLIPQGSTELNDKKLLNIVEEMSIAAGMPIPKVYLLNESSINAFAAGKTINTAVIGVTKGAVTQLSRDELQGVIAHEFSHILNGDMQLNLRLTGILHGILLIGIIGDHILYSMRYGSRKKDAGGLVVIGIGLMVIGYAGTFFGKLIKASVSRQREYLADASAVQFTRNKDTIAGALKKIGGLDEGSILKSPSASEYSHAYFSNGINVFFESLFSTHPPLKNRIKNIDPGWNGRFISPKQIEEESHKAKEDKENALAGMAITAAILTTADQAISKIGTITENNLIHAQSIISNIPSTLKIAAKDPYSARAMIYTLLIREQKDKKIAWGLLNKHADKSLPELTKTLLTESSSLDEQLILPLLELCVNSLRELSKKQYDNFRKTINIIITHDKTVDLNEWVIQRLVLQQLDEHFLLCKPAKAKHAYLGAVKNETETMLSLIAYIEHKDSEILAKQAFDLGVKEIGAYALNFIPQKELSLGKLNSALDELIKLKPLLKPKILKACATIIMTDGKYTRKGIELFRTFSTSLNCPTPPLI